MNRIFSALFAVVTALALAGCGGPSDDPTTGQPAAGGERQATTTHARPSVEAVPDSSQLPTGPDTAPRDYPLKQDALDAIVQQYQSLAGQNDKRSTMISEVGNLVDDQAAAADVITALAKMYGIESDPELKVDILDELGFLEHPAALDPLLKATGPGEPADVQEAAIEAVDSLLSDLAFTEDPAMFPYIAQALDSRYPTGVREAAISALEDLEDPRGIPVLQKLLNDSNEEIREAATDAIDWLTE